MAFTENEMSALGEQYGLQFLSQEPAQYGTTNVIAFLTTPNGTQYAAKRFAPIFPHPVVAFQAEVADFLHARGVPTARMIQTKDGSLVSRIDDASYHLMTRVPGRHPVDGNERDASLAIEALAHMNATLHDFPHAPTYPVLPRLAQVPRDALAELKPHIPVTPANAIDEYVLTMLPTVERMVATVEERLPTVHAPQQLIHGDYNRTAVLLGENTVQGIIDFDFVRKGHTGTEVMHSLDLFTFDKDTPDLELTARVNWPRFASYFSAYRKRDPAIAEQIPHMPLLLAELGVKSLLTTWGFGYRPDATDRNRDYFRQKHQFFVHRARIALELEHELVQALTKSE